MYLMKYHDYTAQTFRITNQTSWDTSLYSILNLFSLSKSYKMHNKTTGRVMTNWNYNGVIIVQAYKIESGSHWGSGSDTPLHHWELELSVNRTKPKDPRHFKNICQLQMYGLKIVLLYKYATIFDPNH